MTGASELLAYRGLVVNLAVRDLKLRYKRSSLGLAWSLLNPLFMMAIYTLVFSVFLRAVRVPNYWALVLVGLLAWVFFANSIGSASTSFVHAANLITKVRFPVEALPIASVLAQFVNFLISLAILLVVLLVAGVHLGASLVLLPVVLVAELAFTLGLALLIATLTVYLRDLEHLVVLATTALFYVTPVLYPLDPAALPAGAGRYIGLLRLNPLSWYLESFHDLLFYGRWPDVASFALMLASAAISLALGYLVFRRLRARLPEEV